ncbi:MAG: DNA polymerase III subunit beta [Elainellaceae cyanobacterium]
MKLTCAQSELNTRLSLISRAVPSRPSHPVLANVLLRVDAKSQQVSLTGFDLSLGVQTSFTADIESGGDLTLPAKLLSDIVSRLPDGDITLDDESGGALVTLTSASGRYQVRGMGADEYPELPTIEDGGVAYLPVDALIEGLRGSLFASSTDETKQVLTGVHLTAEADSLEFAATDGHRLAVVQTVDTVDDDGDSSELSAKKPADPEAEGALNVTVPGKALRELERMLQLHPSSEPIAVRFDQGQLVVEWANQRLTSRLLEGQYPNYRQLIPKQFSRQVTAERRLLMAALERIAVLADQKNGIVKMNVDTANQELTLSVDAPDVGSGRESVGAQISGDDLEAAFNVRYLLEGLKAFNTAEIQMQFNTATSPFVISPLGGLKMTYLVMPVQIRS